MDFVQCGYTHSVTAPAPKRPHGFPDQQTPVQQGAAVWRDTSPPLAGLVRLGIVAAEDSLALPRWRIDAQTG